MQAHALYLFDPAGNPNKMYRKEWTDIYAEHTDLFAVKTYLICNADKKCISASLLVWCQGFSTNMP